jgi:membrane associated rhomboid family serine protease
MDSALPIFNWIIIGVTVCLSLLGFESEYLLDKFMFIPGCILREKQGYRLISSGFIHADFGHLFFNMYSLYLFGEAIETNCGPRVLFAIYMAAILGGNLLSLWLHRNHDHYRALGASGGVCGVIFAYIFLFPGSTISFLLLPIPIPSWLYAILFILYSFFGMRSQNSRIGHDAHLGGALVGLAVTTVRYPAIIFLNPILYPAVVVISCALLYYAYRSDLDPDFLRTIRSGNPGNQRRKQFKKAVDEASQEFLHQCHVCRKNEVTHPELDFRVAKDGNEYCMAHLPAPAQGAGRE